MWWARTCSQIIQPCKMAMAVSPQKSSSHVVLHKPCFLYGRFEVSTENDAKHLLKSLKQIASGWVSWKPRSPCSHCMSSTYLYAITPADIPEGNFVGSDILTSAPCWPCCGTACPSRTSSIGNLPQSMASCYKGSKGVETWKKIPSTWGAVGFLSGYNII